MAKSLYVPVSPEALQQICQRAAVERRRPQDEAAILLERALGIRNSPATSAPQPDAFQRRQLAEAQP